MTVATLNFLSTSIGKKVTMAISGFIVFGFLVGHMIGNLQVFLGPEKLNAYADLLKSMGGMLWFFRGFMALAIIVHIISAMLVTLQSWSARPTKYKVQRYRETTYAARTMWWGGPIILLFLLYHLGHLTIGNAHHDFTPNVYNNVVTGFQIGWVSGVYIVTMVIIGLHLYHGLWSMFQTMGANHPTWNDWRRIFAVVFALIITVGNCSIPVAVLAGMIQPV